MSDGKCPVPAPQLLSAESIVETCSRCGAWVDRYPAFLGESDGFWECNKCGCTSTRMRVGRPFGPKSKQWATIISQFDDLYYDIMPWDWETVVTSPPMRELDWKAIEAWFQSQNIFRVVIGLDGLYKLDDIADHGFDDGDNAP